MQPGEALAFGVDARGRLGRWCSALLVNWFAAALLAFTIFFYVVVYTMWLKRSTPQNIVIGGAAGAFPPMIGWAAVTGDVGLAPVLLFLIIFFWTPPHFWALSLLRADDYARAGVPMLPVVAGRDETRRQILIYSLLLAPLGVAPCAARLCRARSTARSRSPAARVMVALAWRVYRDRDGPGARPRPRSSCSPSRSSISSCCSPRCWSTTLLARLGLAAMSDEPTTKTGIVLTEEQKRRRRARSIAIALSLGVLVVLFYVVTLVKGPAVLIRPL